MTYQVSCTGSGSASISGNTLNIVAGNTSGTMTVTIQPMIDGIRVGKAKVITIEVKGSASANNGATGTGGANNGGIENSQTLKNNMSGYCNTTDDDDPDAADGVYNFGTAQDYCYSQVEDFLDILEQGLICEGYDSQKLETAKKMTMTYFDNLIKSLNDYTDDDNGRSFIATFTVNDKKSQENYYFFTADEYVDAEKEAINNGANISVITNEHWLDNEHAIMIKHSFIIQKFIEFYNATPAGQITRA